MCHAEAMDFFFFFDVSDGATGTIGLKNNSSILILMFTL